MHRAALALLLCSLALSPAAAAPVYKWQDADGVTHYTERPPEQVGSQVIEPKVTPGIPADKAKEQVQGLRQQLQADAEARHKRAQEEAKERTERERRRQACEAARQRLTELDNAPRVAVRGEDGEYRRIDDDERRALVDRARQAVAEACQ